MSTTSSDVTPVGLTAGFVDGSGIGVWLRLVEQAEAAGCEVRVLRLPDWAGRGVYLPHRGRLFILIDDRLDRGQACDILAHELAHHVRGTCPDPGHDLWRPVLAREEAAVDRDAVWLQVDRGVLEELLEVAEDLGDHHPSAVEIAEVLEVTVAVAERALTELVRETRDTARVSDLQSA